jgi:uncharacterized protein with HEPN domain
MLNAVNRAVERLGGTSLAEFEQDSDLQWVMFSQIVLIGEAANRAPEDLKQSTPEIPWRSAVSMRNRIVHGYDSIDWKIVYETVRTELPAMAELLESALVENRS